MAYIVNTDVASYLNLTLTNPGQTLVNSLIAAVDKYIDEYCNRTWTNGSTTNIVETFDGDTDVFFVKNPPVASIISITEDGSIVDLTKVYNYSSYIKLNYKAVNKPRTVVITYRTSSNATPADLKQAEIQWVADMFKASSDAGKVTDRVAMGPVNVDYVVQDGIPKFVQDVLNRYRLIPV